MELHFWSYINETHVESLKAHKYERFWESLKGFVQVCTKSSIRKWVEWRNSIQIFRSMLKAWTLSRLLWKRLLKVTRVHHLRSRKHGYFPFFFLVIFSRILAMMTIFIWIYSYFSALDFYLLLGNTYVFSSSLLSYMRVIIVLGPAPCPCNLILFALWEINIWSIV